MSSAENNLHVRLAKAEDLSRVLELNRELNPGDPHVELGDESVEVWQEILGDKRSNYFVLELEGRVMGCAMLVISPNLTRGMRPFGVLQSVVVSAVCRGKGYGQILVQQLLDYAWDKNCYQVLVQTGRPETVPFYNSLGFKPEKTGLVARP